MTVSEKIEKLRLKLRSHFVSFSAVSSSRHFMLATVLEKRSQMTGYWLVTSYFARMLANLKLFLEILLLVKVITNVNGCVPISHSRNVIK